MASEDLINLDVIETHKENIQSLPGGRSAKALASAFSPPSSKNNRGIISGPSETTNINATIRQGFEAELLSISEADDPLDIYDRYVKWTLDAYPSAQATPQSQLLPLLERATKAFLASPHYKNDPRYLRLWLHYIRLFSDSPKETFAFLARHNVGEGLALFYEEFAAWLESAGRWAQAEEVYMLGIDREARPSERLARKFAEFQQRSARGAQTGTGPSSPVLATVRPALAAKMDPFVTSVPRSVDPQAQASSLQPSRGSASGLGRQKLEIFSDADAPPPAMGFETTKGWQNIGSIGHRKKENVMEPKPWAGETLKAGKKAGNAPKMMVFKDEISSSNSTQENEQKPNDTHATQPKISRTGRVERVFVKLEAVYPRSEDGEEEMSFEELRAIHRGWTGREWLPETNHRNSIRGPHDAHESSSCTESIDNLHLGDRLKLDENRETYEARRLSEEVAARDSATEKRSGRSKRLKIMEVRGETQTIKTNLNSPMRPQPMKRKSSTEPTMTFHTRAATEEIYSIFNQPLKTPAQLAEEATSGAETEDEEDDYASAGESTASGKVDVRSEVDGEEVEEYTASEWSEFTTRKHIPDLDQIGEDTTRDAIYGPPDNNLNALTREISKLEAEHEESSMTSTFTERVSVRPTYIPIPPVDYEAPTGTYREILQASQNRPPLLTPIVERTESSLASTAAKGLETHSFTQTPSRTEEVDPLNEDDNSNELMSSPFQEIINEAVARHKYSLHPALTKSVKHKAEAENSEACIPSKVISYEEGYEDSEGVGIIQGGICNPTDESIRNRILDNLEPSLETYHGFYDRRDCECGKGNEIRKFIRSTKITKSHDRHSTATASPPVLRFQGTNKQYTLKRELGQGAFAPVYLVETSSTAAANNEDHEGRQRLEAIKMEQPPSAWEFYVLRQAKQRLRHSRAADSILSVHELHLFRDEVYLIEEYRDQGTLLDLINFATSSSSSSTNNTTLISTGTLDESLIIFFTIELFRTVEALHSQGILHGDLKPDNCLLRISAVPAQTVWTTEYQPNGAQGWSHKGISLIDFGRGIDLDRFAPGTRFKANWPTSPTDCPEIREGRPWTYQIDYHGLAGIIHTMLYGKYMQTTVTPTNQHHRPTEKFKRYWQVDLWTSVFDLLLNPSAYVDAEAGGEMPLLNGMRATRERLEHWLVENAERKGLKTALARVEERLLGREKERERGRRK